MRVLLPIILICTSLLSFSQQSDSTIKIQRFSQILTPYLFPSEDPQGEEDVIYAVYDMVNVNFYNYSFLEQNTIKTNNIERVCMYNGEQDSSVFVFDTLGRVIQDFSNVPTTYTYLQDSIIVNKAVYVEDSIIMEPYAYYQLQNSLPISWEHLFFKESFIAAYNENSFPKEIIKVWQNDTIEKYNFEYSAADKNIIHIYSLTDTMSYVFNAVNLLERASIPPFEIKCSYTQHDDIKDSLVDSVQLIYKPLDIVLQTVLYHYNSDHFVAKVSYVSNDSAVEQCCEKQYVDFAHSFSIGYEYNKYGDVISEEHITDFSTWRRRYVYTYRDKLD